jgi:hypothetical protein
MNLEEFEALTGVTVTSKYLEEEIAPEYIKNNINKADFCEAWLKAEKKKGHIIKAHNTDFQNLVKENINLNYNEDRLKQNYERVCGECVTLREKNVALEENQKHLSEDIRPLEKEKETYLKNWNDTTQTSREFFDKIGKQKEIIKEKELEIMRLKSMLFDLVHDKKA